MTPRLSLLLALALPLTLQASAHAQFPKPPKLGNNTLTNEVKTRLSKSKVNLDRSERNLKDVEELFARGEGKSGLNTPAELTRIETSLGKVEGWLKDVDEQLSPLPAIGEIAPYHDRLQTAKKQLDELKQRFADSQKKSSDQSTALEAGAGKDQEAMKALSDLAGQLKRLNPQDDPAKIATVVPFEKDAQRLVDTYGALKNATSPEAIDVKRSTASLKAMLQDVRTEHEQMVKVKLPKDMDALLKRLEEAGKSAVQSGNFSLNDSLDEYWLGVNIQNYRALAPSVPGAELTLADTAEARAKQIRAEVNKAAEKVIAKNRLKPSTYTGPDTGELTSYLNGVWKKTNPSEAVLKTAFWGNWERRTSWDWDEVNRGWQKSDRSSMTCAVIVKSPDSKYAYVRLVSVTKNHLRGNELMVRIPPPGDKPANPHSIIPLGNL